jgi:hypothetical protein
MSQPSEPSSERFEKKPRKTTLNEMIMWLEVHPGLATWMQTFGTFVALAIAIAIPQKQLKDSRRQTELQRHERAIQLFDAMGAMANFAGQAFYNVNAALSSEDFLEEVGYAYQSREFEGIAKEFDTYPLHELPDHDSVSTALKLKTSFGHVCAHLKRAVECLAIGEIGDHIDQRDIFHVYLDEFSVLVSDFSTQANQYRNRILNS